MNGKQLDFLDIITIQSYLIGLMNLEENLTQGDKQELLERQQKDAEKLDRKADLLLAEIHNHLEKQDKTLITIVAELNTLIRKVDERK